MTTTAGGSRDPQAASRPGRRRLRRWLAGVCCAAAIAACLGGGWFVWRVRGSLPQLDGTRRLAGLSAAVRVDRDAAGVPTIQAATRGDAARGLGFLHAQERFFQMDLLRRRSAGELAALVGAAALPIDRAARVHRFRRRAEAVLDVIEPGERRLLADYAAGVNAGLAALAAPPVEYLALGSGPEPWQEADSVLCTLSMFLNLQDDAVAHESARGVIHDTLPAALAAFLLPQGSPLDAPLDGPALPAAPMPTAAEFDLRSRAAVAVAPPAAAGVAADHDARDHGGAARSAWERLLLPPREPEVVYGSNNWAVAGSRTAAGAALVAGDMHLPLGVPNVWYRAALEWPDADGPRRVMGVTLPGAPTVVAGSTPHVAWAFTNSEGDWSDLVVLEIDPEQGDRYRTPDGWRSFARHEESIAVRGGGPERLEVLETIWGPVIDRDHRGRPRALRWTAHEPDAVNLTLTRMEDARGVLDAIRVGAESGVPAQNLVCADADGRIAWTIIGRIPRRAGHDGRLPRSWADGVPRWDGWLPEAERPRVVDPEVGRLWSANARVAPADVHPLIGDEGQDVGGRQGQIRDALLELDRATPDDMLALQLDDRAEFLARWRQLLLDTLTPEAVAGSPARAEARGLVEDWGGRAAIDSAGYRIVRGWRLAVARAAFDPLLAAARAADRRLDYLVDFRRFEGPLWTLVTEQPPHLLDPRLADWRELLLTALDAGLAQLATRGPLAERTWGEANVSRVQHPLGVAVPTLAAWLDMPARPLPGDANMPRVQTPIAGASQRMVVSPGRQDVGYFHMPAGQSGHPLSPHYRDGHEAWARGEPTPFWPGRTVHTLTLVP